MNLVKDILGAKDRELWSVKPDDTIFDAIKVMADKGISAVLVMDGDKLAGIVTERDYARKVVLEGKSSRESAVNEVMTSKILCVAPDQTIDQCMALMTEKRIRHLPVLEGGSVVGIVSIGDLVKAVMSDQKELIDQLKHYIAG